MPWPVYSERFLHHQSAGTWTYVVPADTRAIITALDIMSWGAPGAGLYLRIGPILLDQITFQVADQVVHRSMRAVAYQGEAITLTLSRSEIHTTVSGYLMADNTGRTGPPLVASGKPVDPGIPHPEPVGT